MFGPLTLCKHRTSGANSQVSKFVRHFLYLPIFVLFFKYINKNSFTSCLLLLFLNVYKPKNETVTCPPLVTFSSSISIPCTCSIYLITRDGFFSSSQFEYYLMYVNGKERSNSCLSEFISSFINTTYFLSFLIT